MSSFLKILTSKIFIYNVLGAAITVILILGITYKWLASYTEHGSTVTVPDLRGLQVKGVESFLKTKSLQFKISDSTIYDPDQPPGTVVEQDPSPNEKVKENRTIYLSITRTLAPKVKMPNLVDVSFRQAEAILQSYGLKSGKIIYKPDLCKNCVLSYEIKGKVLRAGDEVSKGTVIDLVLGDGFGNTKINVPQLVGLTLEEALFVLKGSSLNAGAIISQGKVKDSLNAYVYRQSPAAGDSVIVNQGESIDLFISNSGPK